MVLQEELKMFNRSAGVELSGQLPRELMERVIANVVTNIINNLQVTGWKTTIPRMLALRTEAHDEKCLHYIFANC